MATLTSLQTALQESLQRFIEQSLLANQELTLEIAPHHLLDACAILRDAPAFDFKLLVDVCGVDYLHYGLSEWETTTATGTGFSRGVERNPLTEARPQRHRFATVYHLLSLTHNHRLRLRVLLDHDSPTVPSVTSLWPSANWFEREAFDLFGIHFSGHPDLRRILTDYGFVGHPFRKDFPLIGRVEARYDATQGRVIYEPVSIEARILEPKVIRKNPVITPGEP